MLVRKNTKAFKTILEIVTACRDRPDREALIRLYITKAGDTLRERISVEGIEDEAGLFYEMNYQAVLGNLKSSNHQLHHSDEVPGVYFFHSSSNKVWDETPEYILPYLKDRPQFIHLHRDGREGAANMHLESLAQNSSEEMPDWLRTASVGKSKAQKQLLLCNDREHLLFYAQTGCVEFRTSHSRIKSFDSPDYLIIAIESPDYELIKAVEAALAAKEILVGLQLPSFVKTDAASGLHLYIPLDSRSAFEDSKHLAKYLCKLIRLKIPALVTLKESGEHVSGKVSLDYRINEQGKGVIAPYSLGAAHAASVATPIFWEEVKDGLTAEAFNHETIFQRLKDKGDPFAALFRKKVNADDLLERIEDNYSFLF